MAWFALARVLFVAAVAYAAALLQPLAGRHCRRTSASALALAGARRPVREPAARDRRHPRARRADRLRRRPGHRARHRGRPVLGRHRRSPRRVPPQLPPDRRCRTSAWCSARKHGEWLEPARLVSLFRAAGPAAPLQDSRHQRHHRRPHRRRLRDRLRRRHAGHPAVRAEGAAARRRLVRLAEAQPRPPRPRHPAEDSEDVGRRGDDLGRRLSRTSAKSISS